MPKPKEVDSDVVRQLEHTVQQLKRKLDEKDAIIVSLNAKLSTTSTEVINGFWSMIQEKEDALIAKDKELAFLKRTVEQQRAQLASLNEQSRHYNVLREKSKRDDETISVLRTTVEKLQRKCNARTDYDILRYERDRLSEQVEESSLRMIA